MIFFKKPFQTIGYNSFKQFTNCRSNRYGSLSEICEILKSFQVKIKCKIFLFFLLQQMNNMYSNINSY